MQGGSGVGPGLRSVGDGSEGGWDQCFTPGTPPHKACNVPPLNATSRQSSGLGTFLLQLDQPPLGLPARDYFLAGRRNSAQLVEYELLVSSLAVALGASPQRAARHAADLVQFEVKLAKVSQGSNSRPMTPG